MGALYGSITQNYGFCGPGYFHETEKYSALARKAFGEGEIPEHKEKGWLRQLHYLAYAELDAGLPIRAKQTLFRYFEIKTWKELWPSVRRFSEWHHALLARFLAEAGDTSIRKKYFDLVFARRQEVLKPQHPRQLWAYNLGRLAQGLGRKEEARELYSESLALSLSREFGPTVHVMALLPLSGLWNLGSLSCVDYEEAEKVIRSAAARLHPEHFRLLHENDLQKVLREVSKKPGKMFPFTYH